MGIENPVHLLFIAAVALIVLGPKRLPELARAVGKAAREFRESLNDGAGVHVSDGTSGHVDEVAGVQVSDGASGRVDDVASVQVKDGASAHISDGASVQEPEDPAHPAGAAGSADHRG